MRLRATPAGRLTLIPALAAALLLPCLVGYTGGAWGTVDVKIVDVYPGDQPMNGVAISELKLNAGSIEEF